MKFTQICPAVCDVMWPGASTLQDTANSSKH